MPAFRIAMNQVREMQPFLFGPPDRRLFGVLTRRSSRTPGTTALLLCNPYGQEAVRVHRLFRVLAERAARKGLDVLRFDYFGTGDSAGADVDGDLDGWVGDIVTADEELRRRARPGRVVWLGARLGAALAVMATSRARSPDLLVLWEPVFDGAGYVHALARSTVNFVQESLGMRSAHLDAMLAAGAPELEREGVGFELGERLHRQLNGLTAEGLAAPRAGRVDVIQSVGQPQVAATIQRWRMGGGLINQKVPPVEFTGLADEAWNSALVPAGITELLGSIVGVPS